ncbi:ChaN family lipoprotein [soil metagenome]
MRLLLALLLGITVSTTAVAQDIRDSRGDTSTFAQLVEAARQVDVVIVGERHDDLDGQRFQERLFAELIGPRFERPYVLSLEMFERDVQGVLDEYLLNVIREQDFLAAARPWSNYAESYRALLETAREAEIPVIAANLPSRYASLVARMGEESLASLPDEVWAWLPPMPVEPASDALAARFNRVMGEHAHGAAHGHAPELTNLLAAQNLRDATMAWSIAQTLQRQEGTLVFHVTGAFHTNDGLGIPEHLARYAPEATVLTVILSSDPEADGAAGDFVVRTSGE